MRPAWIDPVFGPTNRSDYWSATSLSLEEPLRELEDCEGPECFAWGVLFNPTGADFSQKGAAGLGRAVRSGQCPEPLP